MSSCFFFQCTMQRGKCQKLHTGFFRCSKKPSPHRGSHGCAKVQSLPSQGRWLGEAETERSQQICDNLSVSLRLTAPLKGEPFPPQRGNPSGAPRQLPLTRGASGACKTIKTNAKRCSLTISDCTFYLPQIFKRNCSQIQCTVSGGA